MKKSSRKNKRAFAVIAIVTLISIIFCWSASTIFTSCANARNDNQQQESVENDEVVENTPAAEPETPVAEPETTAEDGESTIPEGYVSQEDYDQISEKLTDSEERSQDLAAENSSLGEKLETAISENAKAQKEISTQKARVDAAEKLADLLQTKLDNVHPITVKNGKVWVHIDDFLNAANGVGAIIKSERGYAMRATSGTHVVIYDDMSWERSFLVENFDLPMTQAYEIALTRDEGKTAFAASFGNYSWANGGLFTDYRSVEFAKELTSMPKNGKAGEQFFALLSYCAVVTEVDGEYRFAIYAGDFEANPTTPATQPTTNPETVVKEIVKEVTKTEKVYVDRCGRCGHLIEDCICEPEVKVVEKTNVIVKEVEKIIEKPVEPEKPDTPDEPEKPNTDHNDRPNDSNTDHNDRPWDNDDNTTGDVVDGSDDDITGDIHDDDSDHNPREDDGDITGGIHDPFDDDTDITGEDHDPDNGDITGDSNSTDHSPREEDDITGDIHDPFDDITDDSNNTDHSPREEDNSNSYDNAGDITGGDHDPDPDNGEITNNISNPVGNDTDNSNLDDVDITGSTANNSGTGHSERP